VVPEILPHILSVAAFAAALTTISWFHLWEPHDLTVMPVTLLGIVLSILLGFRNNACYDRWWEARKQWGAMVNEVRSLARASASLLGEDADARRQLLMLTLGYAHSLRGQLRNEDVQEDLKKWLAPDQVAAALAKQNRPDWCLQQAGKLLGEEFRQQRLDSMGLKLLDERLTALAEIQAGCERIASTPLPFAYSLLVHRTSYMYCYLLPFALIGVIGWATPLLTAIVAYTFFGIDRLSDHLVAPFGRDPNDLPLDALCRIHEISVTEALGEEAPEPLQAKGFLIQ
jgi:putative membrane protein